MKLQKSKRERKRKSWANLREMRRHENGKEKGIEMRAKGYEDRSTCKDVNDEMKFWMKVQ
jgi:hypothetical protein